MKGIRAETATMGTEPRAQLNFERQLTEGVNYNIDEKIISHSGLSGLVRIMRWFRKMPTTSSSVTLFSLLPQRHIECP